MRIVSKNPKPVCHINGTVMTAVETIKGLGVHMSNESSWCIYANDIVTKANRVCNVIVLIFVL